MKIRTIFFALLLSVILSVQSHAAIVSPIAGNALDGQDYMVELQQYGYFYKLNVYDDNQVLLDSTIQFSPGEYHDAFILQTNHSLAEIMVVISAEDMEDKYQTYIFDGNTLTKS